MNDPILPDDIDAVIHERVRLAIVAALAVSPEMSFGELKATLGVTDGNLSAHSRTLDEAGYIVIEKTFKGRRPLTTMRLTNKGRKAFERYLETLQHIVDQASPTADRTKRSGKP
jgi:DNA-binding MarR family transcriptional regulator